MDSTYKKSQNENKAYTKKRNVFFLVFVHNIIDNLIQTVFTLKGTTISILFEIP